MAPPDVKAGQMATFNGMRARVKNVTFIPGDMLQSPEYVVRYKYKGRNYQSLDCYAFKAS